MTERRPFIIGVGGTLRPRSSSEALLQLTLSAAEKAGAEVELIAGRDLVMPAYDPQDPSRTAQATHLVSRIARCDGLVIASPGYHGSVSGLIKNALDYVEDLRDHDPVYLEGRAVGCIGCGAGWQAASATLFALRSIAHALRGWPTPMGGVVNTSQPLFDPEGRCLDAHVEARMALIGRQLVEFAHMRNSSRQSCNTTPHSRADAPSRQFRASSA